MGGQDYTQEGAALLIAIRCELLTCPLVFPLHMGKVVVNIFVRTQKAPAGPAEGRSRTHSGQVGTVPVKYGGGASGSISLRQPFSSG